METPSINNIKQIKLYNILSHPPTYSHEDLILNKDIFMDIYEEGDYIRIFHPNDIKSSNNLVFQIKSTTLQHIKPSTRLEISISKFIASLLGIKHMNKLLYGIEKISAVEYGYIDYIELSFHKQFLQRGNMWRFKNSMLGRTIYLGQTLNIDKINAQIQEIGLKGQSKTSGIVLNPTNFIFRSRSSRIIWLIQISKEMWTVDDYGQQYYEKFLYKFVEPLLDRWKALSVSHSLTVIFYTRSISTEKGLNRCNPIIDDYVCFI